MNGPEQTQHIKVIANVLTHLLLHPYDACTNIIQKYSQQTNLNTHNCDVPRNSGQKTRAGHEDKHVLQSILTIARHNPPTETLADETPMKGQKNWEYTRSIRRGALSNDNSNTWNTGSQNPFTQSSKSLNIQDHTSNLTQRIQNRFYYLTAAATLALLMIHQPKGRAPPRIKPASRPLQPSFVPIAFLFAH